MNDVEIFETQNLIIKKQSDIINALHQMLMQCISIDDGRLDEEIGETHRLQSLLEKNIDER